MPRPTRSEINAEIIDRAAGLFAKHGFEHTSIQQIADAVRYSKAGLLHHYPSKKAIYDAVIKALGEHTRAILANVDHLAVGVERDRAVVEASVDFAFDCPGVSALSNRIAATEHTVDPELGEIGLIFYAALGIDLAKLELDRIIRVTTAFSGLSVTAVQAVQTGQAREWRGYIIDAAMDALGHRTSVIAEDRV
ncbi:TetR/AcrR family transcriptional regulator [Ensifer sp. ENS06]|uniref:TetR/AcrR family transcriptional regulator n=1 Tax=Ensifer sp. ENS06 TaxID=2769276 RepID=UPI000DDC7E58|nr:TetR/AcrR family transcriptional regulator [Ensifer sp. ENS06]MBD9626344.1 TetR/AcrR family transcriptional regulator [Ensifer sp. ENS06]